MVRQIVDCNILYAKFLFEMSTLLFSFEKNIQDNFKITVQGINCRTINAILTKKKVSYCIHT